MHRRDPGGVEDRHQGVGVRVHRHERADDPTRLLERLLGRVVEVAPHDVGRFVTADGANPLDQFLSAKDSGTRAGENQSSRVIRVGRGVLLGDEAAER